MGYGNDVIVHIVNNVERFCGEGSVSITTAHVNTSELQTLCESMMENGKVTVT